jgi:hypothetical protein
MPTEWQDDDYILALAHLEALQEQVTSLRSTIPQLVRSLTRPHNSPQSLYDSFSTSAISANKRLAEIKKGWEGSEMREIRGRTEKSTKEYGRSVEGVPKETVEDVREGIMEMPLRGWREEGELIRSRKRKTSAGEGGDTAVNEQQVEKTIEEFRKRHQDAKVDLDTETQQISVDIKPVDYPNLHFTITPTKQEDKPTYIVAGPPIPDTATKSERKLLQAIQRCISNRPKQGVLEYTLDMLAAYQDLGAGKCDVCGRLVDGEMMLSAGRRKKRVKIEGVEDIRWVSVHESCGVKEKEGARMEQQP